MEEIDRDDAGHLKNLRLAAGFDHAQLAAKSNLSVGQLRQLEEGGDNLFYSPQIKSQSMRRVIRLLENPTPAASLSRVEAQDPIPRASNNVIEDIIRLSETNLKDGFLTSSVRHPVRLGWTFSFIVFILLSLAVFSWLKSSQQIAINVFTEWIDPPFSDRNAGVSPSENNLPQLPSMTTGKSSTQEITINPVPTAPEVEKVQTKSDAVSSTNPVVAAPKPADPVAPSAVKLSKPSTEAATLPAATTSAGVSVATSSSASANAIPPSASASAAPKASLNAATSPAKEKAFAVKPEKNDCSSINSQPVSVTAYSVTKPASYVYLLANQPVQICVDDGAKNHTVVNLELGIGRSIHGTPPWTLSSRSLSSVQIYFQGSKLMLPSETANRIYLKEQSLTP